MKLIKPSFEIWEQEPGLQGIYKQIEKAAKVCYKSEGNITEDSAKPFIDNVLLKRGHYSPLEHGTVYLKIPIKAETSYRIDEYNNNPYTKTKIDCDLSCYYISSNYRVLVEHNWLDDLKYLCEPTEYHVRRVTVHFVCDRGILAEFTRHRVFSFSAESTRYCNYSKDKFGNEITFISPCWLDIPEGNYVLFAEKNKEDLEFIQVMKNFKTDKKYPVSSTAGGRFLCAMYWSEKYYLDLLEQGWKPQQAREVLPNALKTELVMTGFVEDWKHFFFLRCPINAHPQARELAIPLSDEFVKRGYIDEKNS